jgi:hypothetical protein
MSELFLREYLTELRSYAGCVHCRACRYLWTTATLLDAT